MKCRRSVVNHQEEVVRINPREVIINHDLLDDTGPGVPTLDYPSQYRLVHTLMLTVGDEGDRMVDLHLVRNRPRDGVRGHMNLSHH